MDTSTAFLILSAYRVENLPHVNEALHSTLGHQIKARGFEKGEVTSVEADFGEEKAYVVPLRTGEQIEQRHYLYQLARHYGQHRIVYVDTNRYATEVDLSPGRGGPDIAAEISLGKWDSISPLEASLRSIYFRDADGIAYAATEQRIRR